MTKPTDKYLWIIDADRNAGFTDHQEILVQSMVNALWLGRTLVIPTVETSSHHNFDQKITATWDKYHDFDQSYLIFRTRGDSIKLKAPYITQQHFNKLNINKADTLEVGKWGYITAEQNHRYALIIHHNPPRICEPPPPPQKKLIEPKPLAPNLQDYATIERFPETISLELSKPILELANQICSLLPTPLNAAHLRRGDILAEHTGYETRKLYTYMTNMTNVVDKITRAGLAGKTVYVMTNADNPDKYLAPLRKICTVLTYRDFPQLLALIDGSAGEIDNNMLFATELAIAGHAEVFVSSDRNEPDSYSKLYLRCLPQRLTPKRTVFLKENVKVEPMTKLKFYLKTARSVTFRELLNRYTRKMYHILKNRLVKDTRRQTTR